jgi:hypothetical protein
MSRVRLAIPMLLALAAAPARAYPVGKAVPLDDLEKRVDLVAKATVVSEHAVTDPWFIPMAGFEAREAELQIVSILKGPAARTVRFRHYAPVPGAVGSYAPQHYQLDIGATYVVFAKHDQGDVYRQWNASHTMKEDEGILRTATVLPHRGKTARAMVWAELTELVASSKAAEVVYGIRQLDTMSGGRVVELHDFDRQAALAAVRPQLGSNTHDVANAALAMFGDDTQYLDDGQAVFWLVGLGKGEIPGFAPRAATGAPAAAMATTELIALADTGPDDLRARAIRVLGRTRAAPAAKLEAWSRDPDAGVRAAATVTSAERADRAILIRGARDSSPEVRTQQRSPLATRRTPPRSHSWTGSSTIRRCPCGRPPRWCCCRSRPTRRRT